MGNLPMAVVFHGVDRYSGQSSQSEAIFLRAVFKLVKLGGRQSPAAAFAPEGRRTVATGGAQPCKHGEAKPVVLNKRCVSDRPGGAKGRTRATVAFPDCLRGGGGAPLRPSGSLHGLRSAGGYAGSASPVATFQPPLRGEALSIPRARPLFMRRVSTVRRT